MDLQPKLLRVLQEHELRPVGGSDTLKVDVRVIAATNRDLDRDVDAGTFRRDLYARLSLWRVSVPSLDEPGRWKICRIVSCTLRSGSVPKFFTAMFMNSRRDEVQVDLEIGAHPGQTPHDFFGEVGMIVDTHEVVCES